MTIRRAFAPAAVTLLLSVGAALAQGFPAPLPGQSAPPAGASPFPPVNGAAPAPMTAAPSAFPSGGAAPFSGGPVGGPPRGPSAESGPGADCQKNFLPLRNDAEKKGQAIKAASERKAPPDEACKLISAFSQAETRMIRFIEANAQKCGIPPQIAEQLKAGHKNTESMNVKVCQVAQQMQNRGPAGPSLSEVLGSSTALPEATPTKKSGGSTFDTLTGNVLTR